MLAYNYKLYLFLPLLATASLGDKYCESFQEVMLYNKTSSVVSAPGFVESMTIPPAGKNRQYGFELYEDATGTITPVGTDGPGKVRHLGFNKRLTLTIPGTGKDWTGFKKPANSVKVTDMMDYFADGGVGVVIDLENHSKVTAIDMSNLSKYTATPAKLYKVVFAVQSEVEMDITISHANVLSISMRDYKEHESNRLWMATDDGATANESYRLRVHSENSETVWSGQMQQPNTCFERKMSRAYTVSPTPSPTTANSGSTSARGSAGMLAGMVTLFAAAFLAVQNSG